MEFFFKIFSAWSQVMYMIGGLVCLGLAALIIFAIIQERMRSVKVKGRIVAVRMGGVSMGMEKNVPPPDQIQKPGQKFSMMEAVGHYYYPVYEYTNSNGETVRVHTSSGSTALADKMPGREVELLINPEEPWKADQPGIIGPVIAAMCALPGFLFMYVALSSFEFNIYSVPVILVFLAYFTYKFIKTIKPRDQWEEPSAFKQRRREERRKKMENPAGSILSEEEFKLRLDAIDRYTLLWLPVMLLISLGLIGGGFYIQRDLKEFSLNAQIIHGKVVAIKSESSSNSNSYHPIVSFETDKGKTMQFEDGFGSNPSIYKTGDAVNVLYNPAKPYKSRIDHGPLNNLPAAACYFLGALMFWGFFRLWNGIRSRRSQT